MKKYLLLGLSLILSATLWAQERTVTGTVTDAETGEAVPGANVVEKGTTNGTITDFNGQYKLAVGDGATLVFSFVGYASSEAVVGSRGVIDAALDLDVQSLSEVVVVGYGTQDKKEITSSVASISSEDFNRGTVNDPVQLLQGKVAGLNITKPGGDPNGGYNIRLRGISTVGANASPLVVIDGVIGGSLSTVDPNDIASIDILKDGSAAAIYGTRGSSGVILVTTKTGSKGKMQVDYNGSYAVESIYNTIDFMTADEYREVAGAQDFGSDTDWMDEVTQLGQAQVHNLSLSGGTGQTSYRISMNYRDTEGIGVGTGFSQLNGRVNITQRALNDRAKITVGVSSTTKEANYGFAESFRYAVVANPTMPVNIAANGGGLTAQGGYAQRDIFDFFNPVAIAEQNVNEGVDHRILASVKAEYDFSDLVDGLSASVFYSRQEENDLRGEYYSKSSKFRGAGRNGFARKSNERRTNQLFESTVNYNKDVSDLNIALLGGYSYQEFFTEGSGMEGGDFLTDAFGYNNMGAALDFANGLGNLWSYANSYKLIGFFGRLNLNYDNTYFLSASARYEGSSRFGINNRWGIFPAVSAGVNITNLVEIPTVNSLKLRGSFGSTGNIPGQSYLSLQRYGPQGNFFYNGEYVPSFGPVSNPNPDLSWETKDEIDVGIDFTLLDNKLSGTVDWYTRTTTDMILSVNVPVPPNLFGQTWVNIGEFANSGLEIALNYQAIVTNDFTWSTGVNFSTFKTEVVSLTSGDLSFGEGGVLYRANMGAPGQNDTELVRVKEGEELGQLWGPVQIGVDEDGTPRFADLSGDGSYCNCDDDRTVLGSGLPDATFGFNNSFTYKNFDLNVFIRGAVGHDLLNSYRGFYENTESTTVGNYNVVKTKYYDPSVKKASVNSVHVESADYVKIDNATIGYNFPMQSGSAVRKLRLFASVQNPFVLTNYSGVDPEVRYEDRNDSDNGGRPGDADTLSPGIERRSTYFTTRTFTLGLNLGF
ncbi:MAG: TonB-dependent receptor [Marinoscillum sp.]|uniref:SusC/RagA family TonB-linked outer membrane protein n=1 Tax=Marinoscillum sp. TaxID=2024838 RepID=UPI0032F6895E